MPITIEKNCFADMDEVYDQLKARKLFATMAVHAKIEPETPHWHKQSNQIFVVEGDAEFYDGSTEEWQSASTGDIVIIPERTLHAIRADSRVFFYAAFDHAMSMTEFTPYPPEDL